MTSRAAPGPADVLLADGSVAVIRMLTREHAAALYDLHAGVSDESLRLRFFSVSRRAARQYVDHVLAAPDTLTLVAEVAGRLVALCTAEPVRADLSEVAFLVADDARGQGVGTLLLEHLASLARDRGIRHFVAEVLLENHGMLGVFKDAGFDVVRHREEGVVVVELSTALTPGQQTVADDREFRTEAVSLNPLLRPRSVALVGVRGDGSGVGAAVLRSIRAEGFTGRLAVVHPRGQQIDGIAAYPSVTAVPGPVDLVVVAVPATAAAAALLDAADAGVRAAVVISSGFGELGAGGVRLQHELSTVARDRGVRLVGPNCLGLLCNDPAVRLNATFSKAVPPPGGLALASQSGGVGIVLVELARELGLGVSCFVSLGNKADVSSNDLLAAWYDDPAVTAAGLYLESFGNARKFARFARRFSERKPLLAVVGGRSAGGRRAGASHTAAAATPTVGVDALFAQSGVIGCEDAEDLAQTALLLTQQPLPGGRRVAVLSNAGGMGVLAADTAVDCGLTVPEFTEPVRARLAQLVHGTTGTGNPVDAGAGADPEQLATILTEVLVSGEVDAALMVLVATGVTDGEATVRALEEVAVRHPELPVLLVPVGVVDLPTAHGPTRFRSTTGALRSLSRAASYAEWRATPRAAAPGSDPDQVDEARRVARRLLESADASGGWLSPADAGAVVSAYDVPLVGEVVTGAEAAVQAATSVGYPVVVKVADPSVVHKTERRLVRVGLTGGDQVREAVADFDRELGADSGGVAVLVQPVLTGVEVALGVVRDPGLGPMVMVAAGGVATDVWDDRVFLLPPVSAADAARALRALRLWPLLSGYRGAPGADLDALERLVVDVGRLAADVPEVAELDLNPVLATPSGCHVVDVKLRLAAADGQVAGTPRQLRPVRLDS